MALETPLRLSEVPAPEQGGRGDYARRNLTFRLLIALLFVVMFASLRFGKMLIWGDSGRPATSFVDHLMVWGSITWVILLPWAVADLTGWMLYRRHSPAGDGFTGAPIETLVSFRVVTVGKQTAVVRTTVESILGAMADRPLFPFVVEVVTDHRMRNLPRHPAVRQLVVPQDYETLQGAQHKARALQYAAESSTLSHDAWIIHLDEETRPTPQVIEGIRSAVEEEEASGRLRVGQGLMLYHRGLETNTVWTLADSVRVADDLGRFNLQYRLNRVLFGMHGSFVLVRNDVEQRIGWDMSPKDSLTEDTTWSLLQMQRGTRFRWVDGAMIEQSPLNIGDFVRQRGRWFRGMWWSAIHAHAALRYRLMLLVAMFVWSVGWLMLVYTYLHFLSGVALPTGIAIVGEVVFAVYLTNYLLGLWVSLSDRGAQRSEWVRYTVLQLVLMPWYTAVEAFAVIHAVLRPAKGFHVVEK
ncbi:MAG: glycosyltransferase family 2 protein [Acidimicrobiia bacterium]|nr:MAG: glycosyltransferase family 2 protein [Acidimicrobiia bacterium]